MSEESNRIFQQLGRIEGMLKTVHTQLTDHIKREDTHEVRIRTVERRLAQIWIVGPVLLGAFVVMGVFWTWTKG